MTKDALRIVVYHSAYGCDTGCCGHWVKADREDWLAHFVFGHPKIGQDLREFAESAIADAFGSEHLTDLDWENSIVVAD